MYGRDYKPMESEYMFRLNLDVARRDKIIFGKYDETKYGGGIRHFENLSLEKLNLLIAENFADPKLYKNESPSIAEIVALMEKYKGYTAHGFVVSIWRTDYCICIEGVEKKCSADSEEELQEFKTLFKNADDFSTVNEMYCWFD